MKLPPPTDSGSIWFDDRSFVMPSFDDDVWVAVPPNTTNPLSRDGKVCYYATAVEAARALGPTIED